MSDDTGAMPPSTGPGDRSGPARAASRGGLPRPALIGLAVLAAIVLILLAAFLLRPDDGAVGEASPSPTASPTSAATAAETPSETAQPRATPMPSAPAIPESWTEAARFSEPGKRYVLGDLVNWSGGLIAVGTLYDEVGRGVFGPPPPHAGIVWRSTDGTDWTDVTPDGTFDQVELAHLFETSDGALVAIGTVWGPDVTATSRAWETQDGESWSPSELSGIPTDTWIGQVASGARGHLAGPYFSPDGRSWEPTLTETGVTSVAAGDEGFVASTFPPGAEATQVVASGDGREWVDATEPAEGGFLAAPRGGDWLATTTTFGEGTVDVATWRSANGLDWSSLGGMPLQSVDVGGGVSCSELPAALHGLPNIAFAGTTLSGPCSEGAVIAAGASYASLDGASWMELPFGEQAFAAGAAMAGDRIAIGVDGRTNSPLLDVVFWISEAP